MLANRFFVICLYRFSSLRNLCTLSVEVFFSKTYCWKIQSFMTNSQPNAKYIKILIRIWLHIWYVVISWMWMCIVRSVLESWWNWKPQTIWQCCVVFYIACVMSTFSWVAQYKLLFLTMTMLFSRMLLVKLCLCVVC